MSIWPSVLVGVFGSFGSLFFCVCVCVCGRSGFYVLVFWNWCCLGFLVGWVGLLVVLTQKL